jgi:hypothetical protein
MDESWKIIVESYTSRWENTPLSISAPAVVYAQAEKIGCCAQEAPVM